MVSGEIGLKKLDSQQALLRNAAAALLIVILPRLFRRLLRLRVERVRFANRDAGVIVREGKRGNFLFCSSEYDPDWAWKKAKPMAIKAVTQSAFQLWKMRRS